MMILKTKLRGSAARLGRGFQTRPYIGNRTKMDCSERSILRPLHIRKRTDLNDRGFLMLRVDICIFCKSSSDL